MTSVALAALLLASSAPNAPIVQPTNASTYTITLKATPDHHPVPIEIVNGLICFEIEVSGRTAWAILDNGSGRSVIDARLAQAVGVKVESNPSSGRTQFGNAVSAQWARDISVTIPGQLTTVMPASMIDMAGISAKLGRTIGFIIGRDILSIAAVVVVPKQHVLHFRQSGMPAGQAPSGFTELTVPIFTKGQSDRINLTANGKTLDLTLDSGSDSPLTVTPEAWSRIRTADSKTSVSGSTDINGRHSDIMVSIVPRVDLGGFAVSNVETAIHALPPEYGDGVLGVGMLDRFSFILDLRAEKLVLLAPMASTGQATH